MKRQPTSPHTLRLTHITTGQTLDFQAKIPARPPAALHRTHFMMLAQSDAITAINQAKPGPRAYATLLALLQLLDYDAKVEKTIPEIAAAAALPPNRVHEALRKLQALDCIVKVKQGRYVTILVNPRLAWKGGPQDYPKALKTYDEAKQAQNTPT